MSRRLDKAAGAKAAKAKTAKAKTAEAKAAGFTYLALLFAVAIMGTLAAGAGLMWSTAQRRAAEAELLFIGDEFRTAIGAYYERTPGTLKRYPRSLDDLLQDNRQLSTVRHLRRIYRDPLSAAAEWGVVRAPDGGISGVYSLCAKAPLKRSRFSERNKAFKNAQNYTQWQFIYQPRNL